MKYLIIPIIIVSFFMGVYLTRSEFSEKSIFFVWEYQNFYEGEHPETKHCLNLWLPEGENRWVGVNIYCNHYMKI